VRALLGLMLAAAFSVGMAAASDLDYGLKPEKIAPDTYVFLGRNEDFSVRNGGNIVNTGFIVTREGVVVIDTGPSRRYAEQARSAIAATTPQPVVRAYNTHQHPDHFLGNQVYADAGIAALASTAGAIGVEGKALTENMYRLNGDWMKGTEPVKPGQIVSAGEILVGGHTLSLLPLAGHTRGDLVVLDRTTGVLFAGDLVFYNRAATTPHADLAAWLAALDALEKLPFRVMVPGHGPVVSDLRAIRQTRDYLVWLRSALSNAAEQGLDMNEVIALPIPERFRAIALVDNEYRRSVTHLYPGMEQAAMRRAN
jgi:quinoprotein relay system zinc metallohydrolase 1